MRRLCVFFLFLFAAVALEATADEDNKPVEMITNYVARDLTPVDELVRVTGITGDATYGLTFLRLKNQSEVALVGYEVGWSVSRSSEPGSALVPVQYKQLFLDSPLGPGESRNVFCGISFKEVGESLYERNIVVSIDPSQAFMILVYVSRVAFSKDKGISEWSSQISFDFALTKYMDNTLVQILENNEIYNSQENSSTVLADCKRGDGGCRTECKWYLFWAYCDRNLQNWFRCWRENEILPELCENTVIDQNECSPQLCTPNPCFPENCSGS